MPTVATARSAAAHLTDVRRLLERGERSEALLAAHAAVVEHPDDPALLEALARLAAAAGRWRYAVAARARLTRLRPAEVEQWRALAHAAAMAGDVDRAADATAGWLEREPEHPTAHHLLAAFRSENPERPASGYVARLFDDYHDRFDAHLAALGYRTPEVLASLLAARAGGSVAAAADLGCGTGLLGAMLRPQVRTLVGVDLSAGMLRGAQARGCYDELVQDDIESFCAAAPGRFDLLAAADVCNYLGEIAGFFEAAYGGLRPGGLLACTFEQGDGTSAAGYRLTPTGRYVHDQRAVVARLHAAGFVDIEVTHDVLRRERGADVRGLYVLACRA